MPRELGARLFGPTRSARSVGQYRADKRPILEADKDRLPADVVTADNGTETGPPDAPHTPHRLRSGVVRGGDWLCFNLWLNPISHTSRL